MAGAGVIIGNRRSLVPVVSTIQGSGAIVEAADVMAAEASEAELLSASDITYLGYMTVDLGLNGWDMDYDRGLTVRRYGSEVRMIVHVYAGSSGAGPYAEFSLSGKSPGMPGSAITSATQTWTPPSGLRWINSPGTVPHEYIFWDHVGGRLWINQAFDYPDDVQPLPTDIQMFPLVDGSSAAGTLKAISLEGVPDRRARGGVMLVPSSAQSAYGYGPYAVGGGGYTSREEFRGQCAMGISLFAVPNPTAFSSGYEVPTGDFQVMATRGAGSPRGRRHWYGFTFNQVGTRALTDTPGIQPGDAHYGETIAYGTFSGHGPLNYNNGGDPRGRNPSVAPDFLPFSEELYPSPVGGFAQWMRRDVYEGGFYLDGSKKGIVQLANVSSGRCFYQSSAVVSDARVAEIHIFDPAKCGAIAAGNRGADDIEPEEILALPDLDSAEGTTYALAWDEVNARMYVIQRNPTNHTAKLHVYAVSTS